MKYENVSSLYAEYSLMMEEESLDAYARHTNTCSSCGGWGDHGIEEETGCLYTCFACGGSGKYFVGEAV